MATCWVAAARPGKQKNRFALLAVAYSLVGLSALSRSLAAASVLRLAVLYGTFSNV